MTRKAAYILGAFAWAVFVLSTTHTASAKSSCEFKNLLRDISKAEEASLTNNSQENVKKELSLRKEALGLVIDCAVDSASELKATIKSIPAAYADVSEAQKKLLLRIDEIVNYYKLQKGMIGDLGIQGSKIFSGNLKSWRDSNYVPVVEFGRDLSTFSKNQDLIQTAQNRFNQINLTMKTLGLSENQKIRDAINEARGGLRLAVGENEQAQEIFRRMTWPNNVSDVMVSSLNHLKDAYQNFFDVGKEAQEMISNVKK